jgi:hypothetical protein
MYFDADWRRYMMDMATSPHTDYRMTFAQYLCRDWNTRHTGDQRVDTFDIDFMMQANLPNGKKAETQKIMLWRHYCFGEPASTPSK